MRREQEIREATRHNRRGRHSRHRRHRRRRHTQPDEVVKKYELVYHVMEYKCSSMNLSFLEWRSKFRVVRRKIDG